MKRKLLSIYNCRLILAICSCILLAQSSMGQVRVLVDQVGYETLASKQAIVADSGQDLPERIFLIDADSGRLSLTQPSIRQVRSMPGVTASSGLWTSLPGKRPGTIPLKCARQMAK